MNISKKQTRLSKLAKVAGALFLLAVVLLVVFSLIFGYGLNLRRFGSDTKKMAVLLIKSNSIKSYSTGKYTNIIFLHQSVGANLIQEGNVRELFSQAGYSFWDQGYNEWGLVYPDGRYSGFNYRVPSDNTYPDGLAKIFSQHRYSLPINTFSALMQHEVLIFKSCYPASDISSAEKLEQYKNWYRQIGKTVDQYPDHLFIFFTTPPLIPSATNLETAARAREFANWLKSDEFLNKRSNLYVFDFFDLLAESDPALPEYNMLQVEYRNGIDSHPNQAANKTIGPILVDFVSQAIDSYQAGK